MTIGAASGDGRAVGHGGEDGPGRIVSVQVGPVRPLGTEGVASGFVKRPVEGAVAVGELGLAGDEQADLAAHGGRDKAVYLYPMAHYAVWRRDAPQHAVLLAPGGFGENLTVSGPDETGTCVGDVLAVGSALLQVSQFREPCFKLSLRFGDERMPKALVRAGRCGWYARVLRGGEVRAGDEVALQRRLHPDWTVARLMRAFLVAKGNRDEMAELAGLDGLAESLRRSAARRA